MNTEVSKKILETLAKLKAHAKSAQEIGNEAEAQAFAEKIQLLLLKYKLEMSDVEFAEIDRENPVDYHFIPREEWEAAGVEIKRRRSEWMEDIGRGVAFGHYCRMALHPGTNRISFIGRKTDVEIASYMFLVLVRTAELLADQAYDVRWAEAREEGDVTQCRGFRKSFLLGLAERIRTRYYDERRRMERAASGNEHALVRINSSDAAIKTYMEEKMKFAKPANELGGYQYLNSEGIERGRRAGDEVNLKSNGGKAGQKRLKG